MNLENRKYKIAKAIESLHEKQAENNDKLSGIERMNQLFDKGSFVETDAFISEYAGIFDEDKRSLEALVTGYGAIDGRLVFAFSQDYTRNKGALGIEGAKKIARLYELALENGAPIVGIFDSNGAKLKEGTSVLAAYGIILRAAARAKNKIPRLSIIAGNCSGANAVFAMESDFLITAGKNASLSLSPLSVLQSAGAKAELEHHKELASLNEETEEEALQKARNLLAFLPSNKIDKLPLVANTDPAERQTGEIIGLYESSYDMKSVIAELSDNSLYLELKANIGKDLITGFSFINGNSCAIIASNPQEDEGKITAEGAKKAAKFIEFCSAFSIPIISLVDSAGYSSGSELEYPDMAEQIAKLASAYASSSAPIITVIIGKAIGSVFSVLGSKMLGADLVLALSSAQIAVMDKDSAINFLWNEEMANAEDAKTVREELKQKWEQEMSTPLNAAKNGHIDFICDEKELRARIASGLSMLSMKKNFSKISDFARGGTSCL